jgi:hypothetical protein
MSKTVKAVYCEVRNVGKHIKATKKKLLWKLELDGHPLCIELYLSRLTNKVKVLVNGDIKLNSKRLSGNAFSYPFKFGRRTLVILQQLEGFDLRIDNVTFSELYVTDVGRPHFDQEATLNDASDNWEHSAEKEWAKKSDPFEKEQWRSKRDGVYADWEAESQPYLSAYEQAKNRTSPESTLKTSTKPARSSYTAPPASKPRTSVQEPPAPKPRASVQEPPVSKPSVTRVEPKPEKAEESVKPPAKQDMIDLMASPPVAAIPQELFSVKPSPYYTEYPCMDYPSTQRDSHSYFTAQQHFQQPPMQSYQQPQQSYQQPAQLSYQLPQQSYQQPPMQSYQETPQQSYQEPLQSYKEPPQYNPFIEDPSADRDSIQQLSTGVVDLDNLHLGDKYSPPVVAKIATKNAIAQSDKPNVPMIEQMKPVQPQTWSPHAMMQYMTGLMMQQMTQRPH